MQNVSPDLREGFLTRMNITGGRRRARVEDKCTGRRVVIWDVPLIEVNACREGLIVGGLVWSQHTLCRAPEWYRGAYTRYPLLPESFCQRAVCLLVTPLTSNRFLRSVYYTGRVSSYIIINNKFNEVKTWFVWIILRALYFLPIIL
jgi:hypothetical protein